MRRVATSCTKGSDRTSYLTRACCASSVPTHLSPGPLLSSLFLTTIPSSSFRVRRASAYSFPRPDARRLESLFIFISFGLVCRLAARHRDYRVPATHLGNSGGPLSAARSSPTTSFPLKRAGDPRGMTTDSVRPGASGTNLPSPPAAPRPSSILLLRLLLLAAPCSGTVLPRYFIPPPLPLFHLSSSPSCSCSISLLSLLSFSSFSILSLPISSRFTYSACPLLSPPVSLLLSFLSFRFCSLFSGCLAPSLSSCLPLSFAFTSLLSSSRALTTCVLLAIQSTRKGSWVRVGDVLIRRF